MTESDPMSDGWVYFQGPCPVCGHTTTAVDGTHICERDVTNPSMGGILAALNVEEPE